MTTLGPTPTNAATAGDLLAEYRLSHRPFPGFPDKLHPKNEDEGYAIQDALHERLSKAGRGPITGWKIGCTTPTMQSYLSIRNPCAGGVFAQTVHRSHAVLRHSDYQRVGVECEIAIRLGRDLPRRADLIDRARVGKAIAAVMAAIEIVEDRYVDYPVLDAPTLIADDFFGSGCVLGTEHAGLERLELGAISARMLIDGREVGRGSGSDILGDPLAALEWLAVRRARSGSFLRAGEIVLLGSLVQTNWIASGQTIIVENDPLGTVRAQFSE